MKILVFAPNHQIFSLYIRQRIKEDQSLTNRDFTHVREEYQLQGYPMDTQVIKIGNATKEDINARLEAGRRFTNIKTIADII